MSINKTALTLFGVTERDYTKWCKRTKRKANDLESKEEFFKLLSTGELVKKDNRVVSKDEV